MCLHSEIKVNQVYFQNLYLKYLLIQIEMQTEIKCSKKELDPLRFLKPKNRQANRERQRQMHQSPHFIKTLNAFPELSPRNHSSNKNNLFASKQHLKLLPNLSQNNAQQNQLTLRNNALIKDKQYNPLRYFSKKVNDYMKNRQNNGKSEFGNLIISQNANTRNNGIYNQFNVNDQTLDLSIDLDTDQKIFARRTFNEQGISNMYPSPQQFNQEKYRQNFYSTSNNFKQISLNSDNQLVKNKSPEANQYKEQQQWFRKDPNQIPQEARNLFECQHCGRKFNKQSYQKHNRICQKVFFQKRKQFDSLEKRSKSKGSQTSNKSIKKK